MRREDVHIGDRVSLMLHPHRGSRFVERFNGTVAALDEPGLPSGVRVVLDHAACGMADCYATHDELRQASGTVRHGRPDEGAGAGST